MVGSHLLQEDARGDYVIANMREFTRTSRESFAAALQVVGNRIAEATAGGPPPLPGAIVINGAGGTLMPGLVESHAHLSFADVVSPERTRLPPEEHMRPTVRSGYTFSDESDQTRTLDPGR